MKISCTHCGLEYDEELMIRDGDCYFCCKGCQGVYHLLKDEGLDSFYQKKGDTKLDKPKEVGDEFKKFDKESFKNKYIKKNRDGLSEIHLIIEGIHCSACVWLNEKVLHRLDGVIEADINFTNHKAKIVFDESVVTLSKIFETIANIGYIAYPYDKEVAEERVNKQRKDYYARLLVGLFAMMNVMWIALAQYAGYFSGIQKEYKNILNIAEFILSTPVLFYTGWPYFKGAYYGLKNHFINMDFLVITGASLAYIYSIYVMITGVGEVYFDSVAMIITFVFVGKYLEVISKKKAVDTLDSLTSTLPTEVIVVKNGEKISKSIEEVEVGEVIEVKAGEKVVLDGKLLTKEASFDLSSLTGESEPILKRVGDEVVSGSIVLDSVVRIEVTKLFADSMVKKISLMLEDAMNKKPKIEKLANVISGYFSLAILSIALITFFVWLVMMDSGFEHSLIVAISVIVIACPCALGLATPIATLVGLSNGVKKGILFKETSFLESMAKADILLLDKTGTITKGKPKVIKEVVLQDFDKSILYSLVSSQTHPISIGVKNYLKTNYHDIQEIELDNIKNISAKGIVCSYNGKKIVAGKKDFLSEEGVEFDKKFDKEIDSTIFIFSIDGKVLAYYKLEDEIKEKAVEVIRELKKYLKIVMLTGDNEKVANKVAKRVGIDIVYHSLLPLQKAKIVEDFQKKGKITIMAGDGINDAVALAKSNIAISMGSGAGIAVEVSDVVLLKDDMNSLKEAYYISKETYKNIKQNLLLSLVYNGITIPLAVAGYVIPLVAAASMSFSSLLVVLNSLRRRNG